MSRNSLLEAGAKSEGEVTATGLEKLIKTLYRLLGEIDYLERTLFILFYLKESSMMQIVNTKRKKIPKKGKD